jgi:hypothetical protein
MKKLLLAVFAVVAVLVCLNEVKAEVFDINKAKFQWGYVATDPVSNFFVKCGTVKGGPYTLVKQTGPTARSFLVKDIITTNGNYACITTATLNWVNTVGVTEVLESNPSNEVFFSAVVGGSPPSNLGLVKE